MSSIRHSILLIFLLSGCSSVSQVKLYNGPSLKPQEEAAIVLPEAFELLELNGQSISDTRLKFRTGDMFLTLPSGEHTLVFQYKEFWQIDDDNHDIVTSGAITFKANLAKAEVMKLEFPDIKNHQDAKKFSYDPRLLLVSKRQVIPSSHTQKDNPFVLDKGKQVKATQYPNLDQLKFWWDRATYYEQQEFLIWQKQ
ncbi:MAG: hypothetical protein ACI843_002098 [Psychrobacter glaciei]|jgi:uncharacterized protein YccT (UPF0319 family)